MQTLYSAALGPNYLNTWRGNAEILNSVHLRPVLPLQKLAWGWL